MDNFILWQKEAEKNMVAAASQWPVQAATFGATQWPQPPANNGTLQWPAGPPVTNGASQWPAGPAPLSVTQWPAGPPITNGATQWPAGPPITNGATQWPAGQPLTNGATQWPAATTTWPGIAGYCYPTVLPGTIPLYRYYSAQAMDHLYTTNAQEVEHNGQYGYKSEGIVCYVIPYYG